MEDSEREIDRLKMENNILRRRGDGLRDALSQLCELGGYAAWQEIETAPKDCEILAYNAVAGYYVTKYEEGQWPARFFWGSQFMHSRTEYFPQPTHWYPLTPFHDPDTYRRPTEQKEKTS